MPINPDNTADIGGYRIGLTFDYSDVNSTAAWEHCRANMDDRGAISVHPGVKMRVRVEHNTDFKNHEYPTGPYLKIKGVVLLEGEHGYYGRGNLRCPEGARVSYVPVSETAGEPPLAADMWVPMQTNLLEDGMQDYCRVYFTETTDEAELSFAQFVDAGTGNPSTTNAAGETAPAFIFSRIWVIVEAEATAPMTPVIVTGSADGEPVKGTIEFLSTESVSWYAMPGDGVLNSGAEYFFTRDANLPFDEANIDNWIRVDEASARRARDGLLRVGARKAGQYSEVATAEFRVLPVESFLTLKSLINEKNDGKLVVINNPMRIRGYAEGAGAQPGNAFYDLYVYDIDGKLGIRYHYFASNYPQSANDHPFLQPAVVNSPCCTWAMDYELMHSTEMRGTSPHRYYLMPNTLYGIYRHNSGINPEIEVSSRTFDYFHGHVEGNVAARYMFNASGDNAISHDSDVVQVKRVEEVNSLSDIDVNHQRILMEAVYRANNSMFELRQADGSTQRVKLYPYYTVSEEAMAKAELTDGETYQVEGFVGVSGLNYAIYPIAISHSPVAPKLLAPNRVEGGIIDIISEGVTIKVDPTGVDPATTYEYSIRGVLAQVIKRTAKLEELSGSGKGIYISADQIVDDGGYLDIAAVLNGVKSRTVRVMLKRYDATAMATIADFKREYLGREDELPAVGGASDPDKTVYCRLSGEAVIVKKTPEYLYVRDVDVTQGATDFTSENYLLVHNSNGWHNPKIIAADGSERELEEGDVVSGFALIPAVTGLGNLVSESTGFARSVSYAGRSIDKAELAATIRIVENLDPSDPNYFASESHKLGESDRMRYYRFRTVDVLRRRSGDGWTYKLKLGSDSEAEWPELTLGVFTVRDGWGAAFGDTDADGVCYPFEITGVAMRNGGDGRYAVALTEFRGSEAPAAPTVALEGSGEETDGPTQQYVYTGRITMKAADTTDRIYYTTDGSDALQNPMRKLFAGDYEGANADLVLTGAREQVVVSAFAIRAGSSPSQATVRVFERLAIEREFVANIVSGTPGSWYHFNGNVRVVAAGPHYMFVRGVLGQYLPIYSEQGWSNLKAGDYLTDFIVKHEPRNGNIQVSATTEGEFRASAKPEGIADIDIDAPTAVTSLSESHARHLVTLLNAEVSGSGDSWSACALSDAAQKRRLATGMLGDMSGDPLEDGATYDITGFVMHGAEGLELWPLRASKVRVSPDVSVSADSHTELSGSGAELTARFHPVAEITLTCSEPGAAIYYAIYDESVTDESSVVWSPYTRPVIAASDGRLHAYAVAQGMVAGGHTHVNLVRTPQSGSVEFAVNRADGGCEVTITPADGASAGAEIFYGIGSSDTSGFSLYEGPFEVTATAIVYARMREPGKLTGEVSHTLVIVDGDGGEPGGTDRVSGRVNVRLDASIAGKVRVEIFPTEAPQGDFSIYYTTDPGKILPEQGTLYNGPFELTESCLLMAVMVEEGKSRGDVFETSVWIVPVTTSADGVGEDGGAVVAVEGHDIIAPQGSMVYDTGGRRVAATGLRAGVYVVVTPGGNVVKVRVD